MKYITTKHHQYQWSIKCLQRIARIDIFSISIIFKFNLKRAFRFCLYYQFFALSLHKKIKLFFYVQSWDGVEWSNRRHESNKQTRNGDENRWCLECYDKIFLGFTRILVTRNDACANRYMNVLIKLFCRNASFVQITLSSSVSLCVLLVLAFFPQ